MPEPSDADVVAMSRHPLHAVWCAGGDASNSPDFRNQDGELDEAAYVRYGLNIMRRVYAEVAAAVWAEAVAALRSERWHEWCDQHLDPNTAADVAWSEADTFVADFLESLAPKGSEGG